MFLIKFKFFDTIFLIVLLEVAIVRKSKATRFKVEKKFKFSFSTQSYITLHILTFFLLQNL